ncbi:MAG: biotin--[acetyl-CoA-carboxylase] ligase [candidate division KSB1 bacterium]|nr:biotin--[acetyl-CoA-carboxylase] ligase [candidate division KSB1 bacterium]
MIEPQTVLQKSRLAVLLKTRYMGRQIRFLDSVGSTNDVARDLATQGAEQGLTVVAAQQTRGRGRGRRTWHSLPGAGLYFSVVLRPTLSPQRCGLLSLAASLAVAEALEKATKLKVQLKWPNDVLVDGKKLCGILAESELMGDRVKFAVIGIGLNTNRTRALGLPESVLATATWLSDHTPTLPDEVKLLAALLLALEKRYEELEKSRGNQLVKAWKRRCVHLGREVRIAEGETTLRGVAQDIAPDGSLVLETPWGEVRHILAGDCHLLPG